MKLVVDNVTGFPNRQKYLKILRKTDNDFELKGAVENKHLLTENCRMPITGMVVDKKLVLGVDDDEYSEIFTKVNSYMYLDHIDRVVEINVLRFNKNYSEYEDIERDWKRTKTDQLFPRILESQIWSDGPIILDLRVYLEKLYELGFRLVRNDKVRDNVKTIYVNLDNVVVDITIDYDAITSVIEIMDMEPL